MDFIFNLQFVLRQTSAQDFHNIWLHILEGDGEKRVFVPVAWEGEKHLDLCPSESFALWKVYLFINL